MKRNLSIIVAALAVMILSAVAMAANRGPANITIDGGSRGKVPFPHALHQDNQKDCNVCHRLFPQKADAIKAQIAKGELKPKQVMNTLCIKCHKEEKRAGKPHGPLTCSKCHVR